MVLVLERGDLLGIFGDLQSSFFLSERTPYQSSGRYERMFHRGALPGKKKKDSCLRSLTFLLRLSFERKFFYLFNKKSFRHFLFCYLLWKTFKSLSSKLLRHRYSECIKAFMTAYEGGGTLDTPQAHTYMCTYKPTHTHKHSHNHKQPANWFRQLNIWHLRTWIVWYSAAQGSQNEQLALSCSPRTLILMLK